LSSSYCLSFCFYVTRVVDEEKRAKQNTPKMIDTPSIHWNSFSEKILKINDSTEATSNSLSVESWRASMNDSRNVTILGNFLSFFPKLHGNWSANIIVILTMLVFFPNLSYLQ
jgi:hypothetical protein